jgi:ABC-2 type transport system permease protein
MKGIIIRIVHQMKNDKRTLALMVIAPLMILTLLYFLLSESNYTPTITVDSSIPAPMLTELQKQDATIIISDIAFKLTDSAADQSLIDKQTDALLSMDKTGLHIRLLESDSTRISHVTDVLKKAMADLQPASAMTITTVFGTSSESIFTSLGFVLLGVLAFFFVFIIAGISFVRERETGTLERLMISPIRRISVVGGYTIGYGIFTVLQSVMMITFSYYVLKLNFAGSIPLAILVMVLLSFSAVSSGALVSIFANNEFQVMQFIPIVVIPQIFFSGLLAIDTLPYGLGNLAYIMPVHYGCIALKDIMLKGYGLAEVWPAVTALVVINVGLFTLNVLALKKYRQL